MDYEKTLKEFVEIEKAKVRAGSGDDGFYEQQITEFANKQKEFLIDFMKFIESKFKQKKE